MGFLETIEQYSTLWNVSKDDNAAFFVDFVLKRYDEIVQCVDRLNQPIQEERDIYYHFFKSSLSIAVSNLSSLNLPESNQEKIRSLDKKLTKDIRGFCEFVNANSNNLFVHIMDRRGEAYFLAIRCLENALGLYSSQLSETTLADIFTYCSLHILATYDLYSGYFKKHKNNFCKLFKWINEIDFLDSRVYSYFFIKFDGPEDMTNTVKLHAEALCKRLLPLCRDYAKNSDDKLIFAHKTIFEHLYAVARKFRFPCANEYRSLDEAYENTLNEYVQKYGEKFQTERFSIQPAIEMLKKDENPFKFMGLTMHFDTRENKMVFFYDRVFGIGNSGNPLVDAVSRTEMPSSANFPYHIQDALWMDERVQITVLNYIVMDKKLSHEFAHYLPTIGNDVDKELLGGKGDTGFEIAGSIEILGNIIGLYESKQHETPLYQALINGLCENVLNTIEKTLRLLTLEESYSSEFFEEKDLTLGQMLSMGRPLSLSRNLIRLLQFHLDADKAVASIADRPGRNLRNIHMHNLDHKYKRTNYGDCLWLLFILMAILNELELVALNKRSKKEAPHE